MAFLKLKQTAHTKAPDQVLVFINRYFSNNPAEKGKQWKLEQKVYTDQISKVRKEYAASIAEKKRERLKLAKIETEKELKERLKKVEDSKDFKLAMKQQLAVKQAELKKLKIEEKLERLNYWRGTQDHLQKLRELRKKQLLEESGKWIDFKDLEQQITIALSQPVRL